ncbi:hypothetical protein [Massilia sp. Se16.2.3]|uniref:hypothetical protein n=1 Tax=Massilia sp. Se16.2.3 TaxID=2709303 RepID=UPI001600EA3F|nr:hypothetical protein [Massilia sp. Se16.2.3]QNB00812.1 hypothetical protein G4G31_21665 [Massilia sp. Se16.2.3]
MGRPRVAALLAAALCVAACASSAVARDGVPDKKHELARHGARLDARKARPDGAAHRFGIIGHSFAVPGDTRFKKALADTNDSSLAFVVVTGIKGVQEPCGDKLYRERRELLERARRPVIVLPAGSDWTECRNTAGRTNAAERLNRMRELFHGEPESLGAKKLPLTRLSTSPRFRSYAENAHWTVDRVMYATVNLPANNNHYLAAAGRNSEYEDRQVATRFWLNRLFTLARRDKVDAIVLFSEGDLKPLAEPTGLRSLLRRAPATFDGFASARKQVQALAQRFGGKVLLVDSAALPKNGHPAIEWRENVGHLSVGGEAVEVDVRPGEKNLFRLKEAGE